MSYRFIDKFVQELNVSCDLSEEEREEGMDFITLQHVLYKIDPRSEEYDYVLSVLYDDCLAENDNQSMLLISMDGEYGAHFQSHLPFFPDLQWSSRIISYFERRGVQVQRSEDHSLSMDLPFSAAVEVTADVIGSNLCWFDSDIVDLRSEEGLEMARAVVADAIRADPAIKRVGSTQSGEDIVNFHIPMTHIIVRK